MEPDGRCGFFEHELVGVDDVAKDSLSENDVVVIADAEAQADSAGAYGGLVPDNVAPDLAVGHDRI